MADPNFSRTLTYICEHNEQGALGLVVNRPIDMTLPTLFERVDLELRDRRPRRRCRSTSAARCRPIAASCCTSRSGSWQSTLPVRDRIGLTTSRDILEARRPRRPAREKLLVTLGYAGWAAGPARARDQAERLAHRRGARRTSSSTCRPRSASPRRWSCSASISPACRTRPGMPDRAGTVLAFDFGERYSASPWATSRWASRIRSTRSRPRDATARIAADRRAGGRMDAASAGRRAAARHGRHAARPDRAGAAHFAARARGALRPAGRARRRAPDLGRCRIAPARHGPRRPQAQGARPPGRRADHSPGLFRCPCNLPDAEQLLRAARDAASSPTSRPRPRWSASTPAARGWPSACTRRSASQVPLGTLDISFYRDDYSQDRPAPAGEAVEDSVRGGGPRHPAGRRRALHRPHHPRAR